MKLTMSHLGIALTVAVMVAVAIAVPLSLNLFVVLRLTIFVAMAIFALSQALVWGYVGIPTFGQAAFFGLGAYTYAIAVINFGDSTPAILLAIAVPAFAALLLGAFLFYSRLSDVYLAVITLAVTLILFSFIRSAGSNTDRIGKARLGGYDGIPAVPTFNFPFDPSWRLGPAATFHICMAALILTYLGMRWLLSTRFGRVGIAIRENENRVELLGYDARLYKLGIFVISGAVAGLAGCLFTNWGGFVSPGVFSLTITAQAVIFVIVGGIGTLIGPIIGALLIQYIATILGSSQQLAAYGLNNNLVFGLIMVAFVLLVPQGIVPTIKSLWKRMRPAERDDAPPAVPASQPQAVGAERTSAP